MINLVVIMGISLVLLILVIVNHYISNKEVYCLSCGVKLLKRRAKKVLRKSFTGLRIEVDFIYFCQAHTPKYDEYIIYPNGNTNYYARLEVDSLGKPKI